MNNLKQSKQILLISFSAFLFLVAGIIHLNSPMPRIEVTKQQSALNLHQDIFRYFSLGNKRMFTDMLWIQTLIESDIDHYSQKDLNGWLYLRFYTISLLDPHFYQNYLWGGRYLSIIKDDVVGAVSLLERGIQYFPTDYRLINTLGFAYFYELGDYVNGIKQLEKIQNHPEAPPYYKSLISKMKVENTLDYDVELKFLDNFLKETNDKLLRDKLTRDYYALKAERDLICLNRKLGGCEYYDALSKPYLFINGKYHSQDSFLPYRLKRKGDNTKTRPITTFE